MWVTINYGMQDTGCKMQSEEVCEEMETKEKGEVKRKRILGNGEVGNRQLKLIGNGNGEVANSSGLVNFPYSLFPNPQSLIVIGILILGFLIVATGIATAAGNGDGVCVGATMNFTCGDTVFESCTFNGDMSCPTGHGLVVGDDNIVIDGNGYCIDGVSPSDCGATMRAGIYNYGYDNVVIKNLEVKNFCYGILLEGYFSDSTDYDLIVNNTVDNCKVHDNGNASTGATTSGIEVSKGDYCKITNCTIYDNTAWIYESCGLGGMGIRLYGVGGPYPYGHHIVTNNTIYHNRVAGIYSKMGCKDCYVAYNKAYENGVYKGGNWKWFGGGIRLECMMTNGWTVEYNNVTDNYGPGIYVRGNNNVIRNNNVSGSRNVAGAAGAARFGDGILLVDIANNNNVTANSFCFNEHAGVCDKGTTNYGDGNKCDTRCSGDSGSITCCDRCTQVTATVYLEPEDSSAPHCNEVEVEIWANTTDPDLASGQINLTYDTDCANVTNFVRDAAWGMGAWNSKTDGKEWITFVSDTTKTGKVLIGTLTVHCVNESLGNCTTGLVFDEDSKLFTPLEEIDTAWEDGSFACANVPVPEKPDLVIVDKSEDWVSLEDKTYNVTYTVKNAGDAEAGASNTTITIDDVDVPEDTVPALAAGANYTNTVGPFTMSGASDTIRVCADNGEVVAESDETNNCVENVFSVPPEYTIKIGNYTINLYTGSVVTVPVKILNATDVAGGSVNISFDPSIVEVQTVTSGHFGTPSFNIDNTNGFVHIATAGETAVGVDEAVLANILFKGTSEGHTDLNIRDALLNFEDGTTTTPATIPGSVTVERYMQGDLNHNNVVDTGDATLVLRMVAGLTPADMLGDMNGNGMVDTGDATLILRTVVGL